MAKKPILTQEEILLAAGVTQAEINAVKTADATTAANMLSAIHKKLISFVYSQVVEYANLSNPLSVFEKSYSYHNAGSEHGFFQEVLVPTRAKGANALYGGKPYIPGKPLNWYDTDNIDFGADPISYMFGINAKIQRDLNYDPDDFLMALNNNALPKYISAKKATLIQEGYGARYSMENNVINCEKFQYDDYANVPVYSDAEALNLAMHEIWTSQKYNDTNTKYKRTKFSTTRGISRLFFILDENFWYEFAQNFQIKEYLKPFVYRSSDIDTYGAEVTVDKTMVLVDKLTPTTLATNAILDPTNMTAKTLPANTKLVGRIVDWNAVKFGLGRVSVMEKPLDARTWIHDEIADLCLDMCDAYINVPILISDTFESHRLFYINDKTPTPPASNG